MTRYCSDKRVNAFIRRLLACGWTCSTGGKHARLVPPGGRGFVVVARTPSCFRALENIRRDIRKAQREFGFSEHSLH